MLAEQRAELNIKALAERRALSVTDICQRHAEHRRIHRVGPYHGVFSPIGLEQGAAQTQRTQGG